MENSNDAWSVISSEYLYRDSWLTVRKDHVVLPNGNHIPSYYILEYPDWVNTIAITRDGQFVFIRQYRHGIRETSYELCAGVCEAEDASPSSRHNGNCWKKPVMAMERGKNICNSPLTRAHTPILLIAFWLRL